MFTVKQIIQQFNSFGFWKVLFGWRSIKRWAIDSLLEIQLVVENAEGQRFRIEKLERELNQSAIILEATENRVNELQRDQAIIIQQAADLRNQLKEAEIKLSEERGKNERRENEHKTAMQSLQEMRNDFNEEKRNIQLVREQEIVARFNLQRTTWKTHEDEVKNRVRQVCKKHCIEYVDNPSLSGRPDNTIKICSEYIVFDAKSPAGEDLGNFANYLKREAEDAKKYAKQNNVSSDIFFIIPSNTLEALPENALQYSFSSHSVFVLPAEVIEVVMLRLKKIEEYEFAEQLSPESRENICRIIARMVYQLKRRIQVDNFMNREALSLANDCGTSLPVEFSEFVETIEKSIKLNPPQDRMGKGISPAELEKETRQIEKGLDHTGFIPEPGVVPFTPNHPLVLGETGS